jgi:hypothetical protein
VRNGYVVLEAYFWPFQNGELHDLASVTKSVTSTLVGIAIGQQKLNGVNQQLLPMFRQSPIPDHDERKRTPPEFEALGRGGQRISVVPARNLVVVFTGGEFEPGDIGTFIGRAIKSTHPLPEDGAGETRLAAAIQRATRPPAAQVVPPLPPLSRTISGRRYRLEPNPLDLKSFTLTFPPTAEAQLEFELSDQRDGPRPVGLDGVPRVSSNGRFGLPVAVSCAWEADSTFVLDYNEIGNINAYRFRMTFSGGEVTVKFSERSRALQEAQVQGRSRD